MQCLTVYYMSAVRKTLTFRIDDDLIAGLNTVQERDGVLVSEQIRRAIRAWLDVKGIKSKKTSTRTLKEK
jgi:hypothetical protein